MFKAWHTSLNTLSMKRLLDVGSVLAILKTSLHLDATSYF